METYIKETKVLVLIIANKPKTRIVYDDLKRQWLRYMNLESSITPFFIIFDEIKEDYIINENDLIIKGTESYTPGIYEKTILHH